MKRTGGLIGTRAAGRYPRRQREEVAHFLGLGSDMIGIEVFSTR